MSNWRLKVKYHITGTTHSNGYCSDPGEKTNVDYKKTVYQRVSKDWVREHCGEDGEVMYSGLALLNKTDRECNGSGYCGTGVKWLALEATLEKVTNLKSQFLNEYYSSDND